VNEPSITVVGNLGADPRLRTTPSGTVVTDFRIASTPRRQERGTSLWADGETMWFRVTCWKQLAEHAAASLRKGSRVVVSGDLTVSTWTGDDGTPRQALEIRARTVGVDLSRGRVLQERSAPVQVTSDPGYPPTGEPDYASTGETDEDGRVRMVPVQAHSERDLDGHDPAGLGEDEPVDEPLPEPMAV
jgi:single-strand DNA-binding protein